MTRSRLPLRGISFKAAASELNLSPSAVSHQIRALEEELGVELFRRVSRGGRRPLCRRAGQAVGAHAPGDGRRGGARLEQAFDQCRPHHDPLCLEILAE